ncbi:unnamed protein product [Dovyalis caffra]|uniref:40S ribosomal protein S27 n=1 Tax=Dovyalis caffra TaxID=77055 RepID=A0AAV1SEJ2_9ROSI|nr:unnamed protein product [Dovyalis caffra]
MPLLNDIDLLNPPAELEKRKHKLKRLVQAPNSYFMDVKCQGCFNITTVFSHSQTVVVCGNCQTVLCQPAGGRAKLTEGCSFRKKSELSVTIHGNLLGFYTTLHYAYFKLLSASLWKLVDERLGLPGASSYLNGIEANVWNGDVKVLAGG